MTPTAGDPIPDPISPSSVKRTASWISLIGAIACLLFLGLYIPATRQSFTSIFKDFGTRLPAPTEALLSIPDGVFLAAVCFLVVLLIAIQFVYRRTSDGLWIHLLMILACCVLFEVYREIMTLPIMALIHSVDGSR